MNEGVVMAIEDAIRLAGEQGNDVEEAAIELTLLRNLASACRYMQADHSHEGEPWPHSGVMPESYRQVTMALAALDIQLGIEP